MVHCPVTELEACRRKIDLHNVVQTLLRQEKPHRISEQLKVTSPVPLGCWLPNASVKTEPSWEKKIADEILVAGLDMTFFNSQK